MFRLDEPYNKNTTQSYSRKNQKENRPSQQRTVWISTKKRNNGSYICFRILMKKCIEVQKSLYVCFLEYQKAFDRVQHEKLIQCLQDKGLDGKDTSLIRNLYWDPSAIIRSGRDYSSHIDIKGGVRQGCVLSHIII